MATWIVKPDSAERVLISQYENFAKGNGVEPKPQDIAAVSKYIHGCFHDIVNDPKYVSIDVSVEGKQSGKTEVLGTLNKSGLDVSLKAAGETYLMKADDFKSYEKDERLEISETSHGRWVRAFKICNTAKDFIGKIYEEMKEQESQETE